MHVSPRLLLVHHLAKLRQNGQGQVDGGEWPRQSEERRKRTFPEHLPHGSPVLSTSHPLLQGETRSFQLEPVEPEGRDAGCLLVSGNLFFWKTPALVPITHKSILCRLRPGVQVSQALLSFVFCTEVPSAELPGPQSAGQRKPSPLGGGGGR